MDTNPAQSFREASKMRQFFKKKQNVVALVGALLVVLGIPLTVILSQQTQTLQQHASELACTRNHWMSLPGWVGGGNALGNGYYCGPENPENHARCQSAGVYNGSDGSGKWLEGPALPAGTVVGVGGNYPNFQTVLGGKLPVDYNSHNDTLRYDFSGHAGVESNWARVLRWTDDYMTHYPDLSPEIVMKYMIMRLKRDALSTGADTTKLGFDVSSIDTAQYPGDGQALIDKMRSDSQSCGQATNVSPTSSQPVSCNVHLIEPPQDYKVDISIANPHSCPEAEATDSHTGRATAQELMDCGSYWLTQWCNAKGDTVRQQDIIYACRGWSVANPGTSPITYFPHRVDELTKNIPTTDDGKRQLWNNIMLEANKGQTSYGNNYGNNGGLGNPKDDADLLARKLWGHDYWNTQKSLDTQNNCSTTAWPQATKVVVPTLTLATPTPSTTTPSHPTSTPASGNANSQPLPTRANQSNTPAATQSNEKIFSGTLGKDSTGRYFTPSAIVVNNALYVFVVGDGGDKSGKPQEDWYNAFVVKTSDGTNWSSYVRLGGNFISPIRANILTTGNANYIYVFGTGTDGNFYWTYSDALGVFNNLNWAKVNPSNPYYTTSKVNSDVMFNNEKYTFSVTNDGQLKVCKGTQGCSGSVSNVPPPGSS